MELRTHGVVQRTNDLVTVIVPIYDVEAYLETCIASIRDQTYTNLEIILVDDGSPDRCGAICDEHALQDERITVIHKENGGLSDARNAGMALANGPYLTFVDSDDWVSPVYIERLLGNLLQTDSDISVCSYQRTTASGDQISRSNPSPSSEIFCWSGVEALKEYLQNRIPTASCMKLYRRSLFSDVRFPIGRVHEDTHTTFLLFHKAHRVVQTHEELYFYRRREDSIVGGAFSPKNARDYIAARQSEISFYDSHGLQDLRDLAAERLYWRYERLIEELRRNPPTDYAEIVRQFHALRQVLRAGNHSLRFRVRTELYYAAPTAIRILRRLAVLTTEVEYARRVCWT